MALKLKCTSLECKCLSVLHADSTHMRDGRSTGTDENSIRNKKQTLTSTILDKQIRLLGKRKKKKHKDQEDKHVLSMSDRHSREQARKKKQKNARPSLFGLIITNLATLVPGPFAVLKVVMLSISPYSGNSRRQWGRGRGPGEVWPVWSIGQHLAGV